MSLLAFFERRELLLRSLFMALGACSIVVLPHARVSRHLGLHVNAMMPGQASSQLTSADREAISAYGERVSANPITVMRNTKSCAVVSSGASVAI